MIEKGITFNEIIIKDADTIQKNDILKCEDTFFLVEKVENKLLFLHAFSDLTETLHDRSVRLNADLPGYANILHFEEFFSDDAKIELWEKKRWCKTILKKR